MTEKHIEGEDSYAYVYCTNYGWNEETYTDFIAETYAINVYYGIDRQYYARANVSVGLYYDDEQLWVNDSDTDSCDATVEGLTAEARVYGNDMIDMDHGIEDFSTDHWIDICIMGADGLISIDNYGQSIGVTTSY